MSNDQQRTLIYTPGGSTIQQFHDSKAFVRGIMGPFGSSKSSACCMEILTKAQEQAPSPDGIRRTRWAIVRNSYPELKTTTIKTWADWCPLSFGKIVYDSPITHRIKTRELDIEILFMALDREEDVRKLLSLETTGAWLNEAREIPKALLDALTGRVGRYPSKNMGGATWSGILMDTNPPDDQSWWYKLAEEETPKDWEFFQQPPGDSPEAENLQNLPKGYYERLKGGKDPDWIKVYVRGEYGFVTEGKAVFPMYRDSAHTSPAVLEPWPEIALSLGVDFGLTPSACIGQKLPDGRWWILDEFVTDNCGIQRFAELLSKYLRSAYPSHIVGSAHGDPAGMARGHDERTAFEIMNSHSSFQTKPAPTNDLTMRLEVVTGALNRMVDGNPGLLVSPRAKTIRKGFTGGYHYKPIRSGNNTQYHDQPNKNQYSHPMDALQAMLLGGGEHDVILNRVRKRERAREGVRLAKDLDYDIFST